ncbi:MAG: SPFH domain-containing protein [Planctomycetota bacterium]|jgi:regulator of protease activity HflC (stomatin/prohibitin superfamily)
MNNRLIFLAIGFGLMGTSILGIAAWVTFRIYIPPNKCAVLVRKTGTPLPQGQSVATEPGQKGIQADVLGPGRHFRNLLWTWEYELKPLTEIPAGNPATWEWIHSLDDRQRDQLRAGNFRFEGEFPRIGIVTRKVGKKRPVGQVIVTRESGMEGILEEVLTPGTYKINPYVFDVELHPATVIPAGFVGVVTNLFGENPTGMSAPVEEVDVDADSPADSPRTTRSMASLANPGERGTLRDVLQPGVYFINPKMQKVTLIEIGYNEFSQIKVSDDDNFRIAFPSDTGFVIKVGVTVVWGIHPTHAAEIINAYGNIDKVLDKIIGPQLRSICRNIGSTYAARDFIQGEKRERFQIALTSELQRVCREKNIEILLALIREIEVHAPIGSGEDAEVTEDLKRTIQQSHIAIENQITKAKQRDAAATRAQLEEERKKVDIARETIRAETRVMVANILAEGEKQAAEIDAQAELEVATIQQEVATLDANRIEILGQANADVERMSKDAEAQGFEMLVNALGGGDAYNLFTFADNFSPKSIRMIFAGDGTFWTDLKSFENVGAAKILQSKTPPE